MAIVVRGEVAHKRGFGMASLEYDVPIGPETVFHVASVSKQFTAMAVALLDRDGRLSLDRSVRDYLTELPEAYEPITLRHLIHHTGGLRESMDDLFGLAGWRSGDRITEQDVLDVACRQRALNFAPGDEWLYSNTGYSLLGSVVRRVTGHSLRGFADERIFRPLGMTRTHFHDDHTEPIRNRAHSYEPRDGGGYVTRISGSDCVGAAGLYTTVEDMALWDGNFEYARVGGAAIIAQIQASGKRNDGSDAHYGFGLFLGEHGGLRTVEHGGSYDGYRAFYLRFPEERLSVIVLCNHSLMNPHGLARHAADLWLGDPVRIAAAPAGSHSPKASASSKASATFPGLDRAAVIPAEADPVPIMHPEANRDVAVLSKSGDEAVALPDEELVSKVGNYVSRSSSMVRRIDLRNGKLTVEIGPGFELAPLDSRRFRALETAIVLSFEPGGTVRPALLREIVPDSPNPPTIFEAVEPSHLTSEQLAEITGRYVSDELDFAFDLVSRNGDLVVRRKRCDDSALSYVSEDRFHGRLGTLEFQRDSRRVTGFTLNTGRSRGLRFERVSPA